MVAILPLLIYEVLDSFKEIIGTKILSKIKNKISCTVEELLEKVSLTADQVAFIGDDLLDLPIVRRAGFGVAVSNAVDELKDAADYITTRKGGDGAVREVIEYILKNNGKWQDLMGRYLV